MYVHSECDVFPLYHVNGKERGAYHSFTATMMMKLYRYPKLYLVLNYRSGIYDELNIPFLKDTLCITIFKRPFSVNCKQLHIDTKNSNKNMFPFFCMTLIDMMTSTILQFVAKCIVYNVRVR